MKYNKKPYYAYTLGALAALTFWLASKIKIEWKIFIPHMLIGSICGWMWGIYLLTFDKNIGAWCFHPGTILGPVWLQTLEDWLFYPLCGAFFYCVFVIAKRFDIVLNSEFKYKISILTFNIFCTLFFLYFGAITGKSIACAFAVPAIVILIWQWDNWNALHYLIVNAFVTVFASLWDIIVVNFVNAQHWYYVTFSYDGIASHSNVFIPWSKSWAWIFQNPIEITPWFGIAGGMFTYSLVLLINNLVKRE